MSVTLVHSDKVPMVPGFGQQPRFIVTIQPAGATFNPPASITLPNVDGLAPGHVTEMYSFDHDLGSFVAIGTGTVSEDGTMIRSNPGVGVLKAGWHCGGNPSAIGTAADCAACLYCVGVVPPGSPPGTIPGTCVPDPAQMGKSCSAGGNPCVKGVCDETPQGNNLPNRPTVQCGGLNLISGPCSVAGQSGTCNGGICQGPPNQDLCPGGTIVNGQCVNPRCTPGTACTAGNNTPGICNENGQCERSTGQCTNPATVSLNGVCVVPDCTAPGTAGLFCNAGGNLPGVCINNQCEGSGSQCQCTPANPNVCLDYGCANGTCTPPTAKVINLQLVQIIPQFQTFVDQNGQDALAYVYRGELSPSNCPPPLIVEEVTDISRSPTCPAGGDVVLAGGPPLLLNGKMYYVDTIGILKQPYESFIGSVASGTACTVIKNQVIAQPFGVQQIDQHQIRIEISDTATDLTVVITNGASPPQTVTGHK